MVRVLVSEPAEADLDAIFAFSADQWGETQAIRYLGSITEAITRASEAPRQWPLRQLAGRTFRCIPVGRHLVFYREQQNTVLVLRVLHASRDIEAALRSMPPA